MNRNLRRAQLSTKVRAILTTIAMVLGLGFATAVMATPASADTGGYPYSAAADCSSQFGQYSWCMDENGNGTYSSVEQYSPYGYGYRNCTDWVAYRLDSLGVSPAKFMGLGNAKNWPDNVNGVTTSTTPAKGAVAVKTSGTFGHVAFVESVDNGTITVSEYNHSENGNYGTRTGTPSTLGFTQFIHFETLETWPSGGATNSPHSWSSDIDANRTSDLSLTAKRSDGFADSRVWLSTGYQFLDAGVWRQLDGYGYDGITPLVADVNADGASDYVFITNEGANGVKVWVCLSTSNGLTAPQAWWNSGGYSYNDIKVNLGDLTGDDKADFVITAKRSDGFADIRVLVSSGTSFQDAGVWRQLDGYGYDGITPLVGDVTGDKKADFVFITNEGANGVKAYAVGSTGTGLGTPQLWWTGTGYGYDGIKPKLGDMDNNGASDLVLTVQRSDGYADVLVLLSTWQGFLSPQKWLDLTGYGWSGIMPFAADTDGDGKRDFVFITNEGANGVKAYVSKSNASTLSAPSLFMSGGYGYNDIKVAIN